MYRRDVTTGTASAAQGGLLAFTKRLSAGETETLNHDGTTHIFGLNWRFPVRKHFSFPLSDPLFSLLCGYTGCDFGQ